MNGDGTGPGGGDSFGLPPPRPVRAPGREASGPRPQSPVGVLTRIGVGVVVSRQDFQPQVTPGMIAAATPTGTAPPASPQSARSSTRPTSTSIRPPSTPKGTTSPPQVAAVVPGWTAVEGREFVAFDVPADWAVEADDVLVGFETHTPQDAPRLVTMHSVASYKEGVCRNLQASSRGRAGFVVPGQGTPRQVAAVLSQTWAEVAALDDGGFNPKAGATTTQQVTIAGETMDATVSTTILTITHPEPCQAPAMAFTAASFEIRGQVVAFLIYTDEAVADGLPADVVRRIITSLRPIGS